MKLVCLLFSLILFASGQLCAQEYGFRMPASASTLAPPVIPNRGQFGDAVRFVVPGPNGTVILTSDSMVLVLRQKTDVAVPKDDPTLAFPSEIREAALTRRKPVEPAQASEVIRIRYVDANPDARIEGTGELPARASRIVGRDTSKWAKGIPTFGGVVYRDLWPGTNLVFEMNFGRFVCRTEGTGAQFEQAGKGIIDISQVSELLSRALGEWTVQRGVHTTLDRQGIYTTGTAYTPGGPAMDKPSDYDADCFVLRADYSSGELRWITFIGGTAQDAANAVSVDRHGYVYVNGLTESDDYPVTSGAYKKTHNGHQDCFTARLKPSGSELAYSTYLDIGGGALGLESFASRWAPAFEGKKEKLLAIMIDDGREQAQIQPFLDLGIPVTFAVMPWIDPGCIERIRARGCAAFLHAPMEALGSTNTRSEEIMTTHKAKQVEEMLERWLALTPGVVGVSNHRGSAATSDPETMRRVAAFAKKHGLMVYDSNTAPVAIGVNVCRDMKVPCLQQDFFLDERELSLMRARMLAMAELAERTGYATCICHVGRSVVPDGIRSVIQELQARGFRFVTVPQLYKELTGK